MTKANIMIVEDEVLIAQEIKISLEGMGYGVTSIVKSGEQTIEKAVQDSPDLILMDIKLHGRMDGIETAELIQSRLGIPVIFLTAFDDDDKIERAKLTMSYGYIIKPFRDRDLKVTIQMALYAAKVDAERRKTEEKYSLLVKNLPGIVYKGYLDWSVEFFDNKIESLTGYSVDEFNSQKMKWIDIIVKEDIDNL
ncbi:MAG: response regulator, partial [Desulfobacterales bacterium]